LTVADTGTGISEDDKPKIFDPFFTTKGPGKGTGLGLAVVHAIINNHGGLIEVSSTLGQGSLFKVYLPVCGLEAT
jgi:signal transduction histidine kinase